MPGSGQPGYGCGHQVLYRCNECGHVFSANTTCMNRECPNCYEKWAFREGKIASWRIWTGSMQRCAEAEWNWQECRILHAVISLPDRGDLLAENRSRARTIAKKHNLDGGVMVCHPFDQDGFVKFHIIALAHGDVLPGGTDGDVIFKVVRDAEHGDYRGFRDVASIKRAVQYLLTHCGIYEGRHALTWWGSLSYNKMPIQKLEDNFLGWSEMIAFHRRCPKCKSIDVEPLETPQDFGWRSVNPIRHSPFYGVPWAGVPT